MSEAKRELLKFSRARLWVWTAVAAAVGATVFTLMFWDYVWGWWWYGFWLVIVGVLVGSSVGLAATSLFPAWRGSDGPAVIGNALGVALMVILWLSLPVAVVAILGYVARAIIGATMGTSFIIIAEFGRVKQELKEAGRAEPK